MKQASSWLISRQFGAPLKSMWPTYTLQLLLGPFESRLLTQCSCCWAPL